MAELTLDRLLEAFLEASGGTASRPDLPGNSSNEFPDIYGLPASMTSETLQAQGDPRTPAAGVEATASNGTGLYESSANPVGSNAYASPSSSAVSDGGGTNLGSIATTFLESGLGIGSVVEGLLGLFGGGKSSPEPLQKYEIPSAIDFESAETNGGLSAADYGQSGTARSVGQAGSTGEAPGGTTGAAGQQITVNVQTMDAQSFMDNSSAIAQAVRSAMLNSSSINDVVNEL